MENIEASNRKALTISFLGAGVLVGIAFKVLLESAIAIVTGPVGKVLSLDLIRHGLPVAVGTVSFLYFQLNPGIREWGKDVIAELRKVVWPSREDTTRMAVIVCVMLVIAGIFLGLMDVVAGKAVEWLLNLNLFGRIG